jgi:hypothetical protein
LIGTSHDRSAGPARPLVSVVIPAYNVSRYVEATLRSLREQTLGDFEIIVVDDASTDDTAAVVERWADPRLRLLRHVKNQGVAVARNTAFDHIRGRYVALIDPDDVAFPDRFEKQVRVLEDDPALGMVGGADAVMDEAGIPLNRIWWHPVDPVEATVYMFFDNPFSTSSLMLRAEAIAAHRYLPMRISEDYEFNARLARAWKVANIHEPLVWRRRRGDGLTATMPTKMLEFNREIIREHLGVVGILPNDREVDLSLNVGKHHLMPTPDLLDETESWLYKLCLANEQCARFDVVQFNRVIAREWYRFCESASSLGPAVLRRYSRSRLIACGDASVGDWVRLAAKCLVRLER